MGGRYCNKCVVAIALAWLLSFSSILYTRLVPADIFPWNTTSLPWHIEYMFQAMFYMVLGYMDILYHYLTVVVGIATLILIAKEIKANRYINYVGQNTLIYFALHGKALSVIQAY